MKQLRVKSRNVDQNPCDAIRYEVEGDFEAVMAFVDLDVLEMEPGGIPVDIFGHRRWALPGDCIVRDQFGDLKVYPKTQFDLLYEEVTA